MEMGLKIAFEIKILILGLVPRVIRLPITY